MNEQRKYEIKLENKIAELTQDLEIARNEANFAFEKLSKQGQTAQVSPSNSSGLLSCPFERVEKEIGHKPYTIDLGRLWQVKCTCGAKGPISATESNAKQNWAAR